MLCFYPSPRRQCLDVRDCNCSLATVLLGSGQVKFAWQVNTRQPVDLGVKASPTVVSPTHCRAEPEGDILILRFWKSNDQPVEIPRNLNLAGKTRIGSRIERDRQHFLLHRRGLTDGLDPTRIDIDVASRTGARTAALREDAPDTIVQRRIHQCPTEVRIDRFFRAIGLDERHPDGNYRAHDQRRSTVAPAPVTRTLLSSKSAIFPPSPNWRPTRR
jgi:hypothetical protein